MKQLLLNTKVKQAMAQSQAMNLCGRMPQNKKGRLRAAQPAFAFLLHQYAQRRSFAAEENLLRQ